MTAGSSSAMPEISPIRWGMILPAIVVSLAAASGIAALTSAIQHAGAGAEHAVLLTVVLFGVLGVAGVGGYAVVRRAAPLPEIGFGAVLIAFILLVAAFLFVARPLILFPADILIWSESPFISDVIKLRVGMPIYTPPADLNSEFYSPGAQLVTHALASAFGFGGSVVAHRAVQLLFVTLSVVLAVRTAWRIAALAGVRTSLPRPLVTAVWSMVLFLAATNSLTNRFTILLHNDGLALLVAVALFTVLVEYAATRHVRMLVAAALLAACGLLVKQSLAIWAPLIGLHLVLFDRPRSWRRIIGYSLGCAAALGVAYGACQLVWGEAFRYWVIDGLAQQPVSVLRGIRHLIEAWPYVAAALLGGVVLATEPASRVLVGPWVVGLVLLGVESYTSGIAWIRNHLGPGTMIATIWLCVLLVRLWPRPREAGASGLAVFARTAGAAATAVLAANGFGMVTVPTPVITRAHTQYIRSIEREFAGMPADRVLLDVGSWVYLPSGVVMRDRSVPTGDLGYAGIGDFSGILSRLNERYYARILMHDLDEPTFIYEHNSWPRPRGIRDALRANYRVVRTIPGIEAGWRAPSLHTISVLEPIARDSASTSTERLPSAAAAGTKGAVQARRVPGDSATRRPGVAP